MVARWIPDGPSHMQRPEYRRDLGVGSFYITWVPSLMSMRSFHSLSIACQAENVKSDLFQK